MAKRAVKQAEVIDLPAVISEDEQFAREQGGMVQSFLGNLGKFFQRATELEVHAKGTLEKVQALKPPTNADEDVRIQEVVRGVSLEEKAVEDEWSICQKVGALHKRLTGKRGIATNYLTQAKARANSLHNGWVQSEKDRVARENEANRRKAEQEAQQKRDRELAEAEALALKAEQDAPTLSEREASFVDVFGDGGMHAGNAASAARYARYAPPHDAAGARLLASKKIQAALKVKREAFAIREQAKAVKEAPLEVRQVEEVKADIGRAAGAHDRTTKSLEIHDPEAFRRAAFAGTFGIPQDIFEANQGKGNQYARDLGDLVNRWPGCRLKKSTGVV